MVSSHDSGIRNQIHYGCPNQTRYARQHQFEFMHGGSKFKLSSLAFVCYLNLRHTTRIKHATCHATQTFSNFLMWHATIFYEYHTPLDSPWQCLNGSPTCNQYEPHKSLKSSSHTHAIDVWLHDRDANTISWLWHVAHSHHPIHFIYIRCR